MNFRTTCAVATAVSVLASAPAALAECKLGKLGEFKVDTSRGLPLINVAVNGKTAKMRVDTGAFATYLTTEGAEKLGVKAGRQMSGLRVATSKGEIPVVGGTLLDVTLGDVFQLPRLNVLVWPGEASSSDVVGSLGLDVLAASDIELDLAHGRIALFKAEGCANDPLVYWTNSYSIADTRRPSAAEPKIVTTIQLNGQRLTAQLTTSRGVSTVDQRAAAAAGVKPGDEGVTLLSGPLDKQALWSGQFKSFAVGEEQINNVRLSFTDLFAGVQLDSTGSNTRQRLDGLPSMMLGLDFLRSHRVFVANSQGKMYFTYNGGPVFARPTP